MSLLIVGCGYVGKAVASQVLTNWHGSRVYALTRSQQSASQLASLGLHPLVGNWVNCSTLPEPPTDIDRVLVAVPHRADLDDAATLAGDVDAEQMHQSGLRSLQEWLSSGLVARPHPKLIYLSTTGVYGSTSAGQRVDEFTPIRPTRTGPRMAAIAEAWLNSTENLWPSITIRLAGIYGPGRIPLMEKLTSGNPLEIPEYGKLNLIHLDDIVQAIHWTFTHWPENRLFVLSDGTPTDRRDFYNCIARLLKLNPPSFTITTNDAMKAQRASDKIVDSSAFWKLSGLEPIHPSFASGLQAICQSNL